MSFLYKFRLFDGKIINVNDGRVTEFNFETTNFDLSKYLTKTITDFKSVFILS